jgi:hypothetical protein
MKSYYNTLSLISSIHTSKRASIEDCINQIKAKKKKEKDRRRRPWLDPKQGSSSTDDDNSMKR